MKILMVINVLRRGGAERVVCHLSNEWTKQHDVKIALFDASPPAYEFGGRLIDLKLPAPTLLHKAYRLVVGSLRLACLFRRERPDRIVTFMESANFPATIGAAIAGLLNKLTVSVHTNPSIIPGPYRILLPFLYPLAHRVRSPLRRRPTRSPESWPSDIQIVGDKQSCQSSSVRRQFGTSIPLTVRFGSRKTD